MVEDVIASNVSAVALIATKRTVESNKYAIELQNRSTNAITLTQIATPELVPFIELNELDLATTAATSQLEKRAGESEGVILGCTHYTQIKEPLRTYFGPGKIFFSPDEIIPTKLFSYLENHPEIESKLSTEGTRSIYLTEHRPDYDVTMSQFLGGAYLDT